MVRVHNRREFLYASASTLGLAGCAATTRSTGALMAPREASVRNGVGSGDRKGYLDGPDGQIHYYQAGVGPALVLAHQSPVSARMFEQALPLLKQRGLCAIAVDTPGYGNSDVPAAPPSIGDYATAYLAVLDRLNIARAHLLGHHTGAAILCHLAARHPARVASLILNGPPLLSAEDLAAFKDLTLGPAPVHADGSHLKAAWDRRVQFTPGWTDKDAMQRRLVDQLWAGETWWYGHAAAFQYDMTDDFMALTSRAMILTNTGDDIYELAQKARRLRPDFAYAELPGGTHDIVDEQPAAWAQTVADFAVGSS